MEIKTLGELSPGTRFFFYKTNARKEPVFHKEEVYVKLFDDYRLRQPHELSQIHARVDPSTTEDQWKKFRGPRIAKVVVVDS